MQECAWHARRKSQTVKYWHGRSTFKNNLPSLCQAHAAPSLDHWWSSNLNSMKEVCNTCGHPCDVIGFRFSKAQRWMVWRKARQPCWQKTTRARANKQGLRTLRSNVILERSCKMWTSLTKYQTSFLGNGTIEIGFFSWKRRCCGPILCDFTFNLW